ncbi:hypothetical protein [Cobetia marina]|uniref:hypothetical protein n=1 Tax=Cobetia marina TaxID=28258 RepID=UPI003A90907F
MSAAHSQAVYTAPGIQAGTPDAHERLLGYWRSLEMVQRQMLPGGDPRLPDDGSILTTITEGAGTEFPWETRPKGMHTVYLGLFSIRKAFERIDLLNGNYPDVQESTRSNFALAAVRVRGGRGYVPGSFRLSTAAWSIGRLLTGMSVQSGFERDEGEYRAYAEKLLQSESGDLASLLHTLTEHLSDKLSLGDLFVARDIRHRVASQYGTSTSIPFALNSPYLEEIERVRTCVRSDDVPHALSSYLGIDRPLIRMDLSSPEGQDVSAHALLPSVSGLMQWPAADMLSKSELLASNLIRKELASSPGLQAVALPQGANEYRLIREAVMESLLSKADSLAAFPRTSMAFSITMGSPAQRVGPQQWILNSHLHNTGVAVVLSASRDAAQMAERLSVHPECADTDAQVVGFVQYGLQAIALSERPGPDQQIDRLIQLLEASAGAPGTREQRLKQWADACDRYLAAKLRVSACMSQVEELPDHIKTAARLKARMTGVMRSIAYVESVIAELSSRSVEPSQEEVCEIERERAEAIQALQTIPRKRGGLLGRFRVRRGEEQQLMQLRKRCDELSDQLQAHKARVDAANTAVVAERVGLDRLTAELGELESCFSVVVSQLESVCDTHSLEYLRSWMRGQRADDLGTELQPALRIDDLSAARESLMIEALRLNAVFMRLESGRLLKNLKMGWLQTQSVSSEPLSREALANAWATLQLAAPVLVMSNETMSRACWGVGREGFDWVVQCDAGKAQPWEIAGAVYRGRAVVVIGDAHDYLSGVIAHHHIRQVLAYQVGVGTEQAVAGLSAQVRAEEASLYGVVRRSGAHDEWAGIPIRAVEAGAEPMLTILERSVYGQSLVSRAFQLELLDDFDSGWIDVRGEARGDWIPHEGRAVVRLVEILRSRGVRPGDIGVVTASHRVCTELKKLLSASHGYQVTPLEGIGHRQREYVILVLGGGSPEWREWASRSASLIALPAAHARKGLYIIGDRSYWSTRTVLQAASQLLPSLNVDIVAAEEVAVAIQHQRHRSGVVLEVVSAPGVLGRRPRPVVESIANQERPIETRNKRYRAVK